MKKQKRYIACYSEKGVYAKYITPRFVGIYKTKKEAKSVLTAIMKKDHEEYGFDFNDDFSKLRYNLEGFGYEWAGNIFEIEI